MKFTSFNLIQKTIDNNCSLTDIRLIDSSCKLVITTRIQHREIGGP